MVFARVSSWKYKRGKREERIRTLGEYVDSIPLSQKGFGFGAKLYPNQRCWIGILFFTFGPAGPPGVRDGKVDLRDVYAVGRAFGAVIGDPRYNANLDINGGGKIDLKDYYTTCKNYGKSW